MDSSDVKTIPYILKLLLLITPTSDFSRRLITNASTFSDLGICVPQKSNNAIAIILLISIDPRVGLLGLRFHQTFRHNTRLPEFHSLQGIQIKIEKKLKMA